jgi:hypothetical protein
LSLFCSVCLSRFVFLFSRSLCLSLSLSVSLSMMRLFVASAHLVRLTSSLRDFSQEG